MSWRGAALALGLALLLPALSPAPVGAQTRYVAFGDSITFGYHDDPLRTEPGYPPRLQDLLTERGQTATVFNAGLNGESTAEGVTRLPGVLAANPADVLLLMEGTNDLNARVSLETITFNLDQMALEAAAAGVETVHATIIPRLPTANFDGSNRLTGELAGMIRELAASRTRRLADPFEVFFYQTPNVFATKYFGGSDKLHPDAAGYDLLAQIFADFLTGVDDVPPVTGAISPADGATEVPADSQIHVVLYDFGLGIDFPATKLVLNGQEVDTPLAGNSGRLEILYTPPAPLVGLVHVGVHAQDLAMPPNVLDRELADFTIAGTVFLSGDINRDGRVDGQDLVALALAFGAFRGDRRYTVAADLNGDGVIDGLDLALLSANFGQSSF